MFFFIFRRIGVAYVSATSCALVTALGLKAALAKVPYNSSRKLLAAVMHYSLRKLLAKVTYNSSRKPSKCKIQ